MVLIVNKAVFLMLYHVQDSFYTGSIPERQTSLRRSAVERARPYQGSAGMKTPLIDAYIFSDDLIKFAPSWGLEPAPPEQAKVMLREVSALLRVLRLHVAADMLHAYEVGASINIGVRASSVYGRKGAASR